MTPDWTAIRALCVSDAQARGASAPDADDIAQQACMQTFLATAVQSHERHARAAAARLTSDLLRERGRAGLTTGANVTSSRTTERAGGSDPARLATPADQEDVAIARQTAFCLLVAGHASGLPLEAQEGHQMARKRRRDRLREAWGQPPGFKGAVTVLGAGSPDDGRGRGSFSADNSRAISGRRSS